MQKRVKYDKIIYKVYFKKFMGVSMKKVYKIANISLGCEKNLVDSEMIIGALHKAEFIITTDLNEAHIIFINTCGFITNAKQEAIDTIFNCLQYQESGAKIVACGCLVQRYLDDLKKLIPEVDLWIPIRDYYRFGELLGEMLEQDCSNICVKMDNRLLSTPPYMAYVRISDGCNNKCSYCAIPLIRGEFVSRDEEEIVEEVKKLVYNGVDEINLISQDLTNYGYDIRRKTGKNVTLVTLLKKLVKIENIKWIRMLYLYPDEITDELIDFVSKNKLVLPYFDIPIQHASDKLLKWMNRRGTQIEIEKLVNKIREKVKDSVIRTTLILGFPHESEKDFNILKDFISRVKFNHLGAFTYSKEEDTTSFSMSGQVPEREKNERMNEIMEIQRWISLELNKEFVGKTYECVIESYDEELNKFYGRSYAFAPDDIDGAVIIDYDEDIIIGNFYDIEIYDADFYDIMGKLKK